MTVYKKLQEARSRISKTQLNKTGKNKFAQFNYFILEDFMPTVTNVFNDVGLCGVFHLTNDMAVLTIHDTDEQNVSIIFSVPLVRANQEKVQAIQSMGATITYYRRYLFLLACDLVEHDELDYSADTRESTPVETPKPKIYTPPKGNLEGVAGPFQMKITPPTENKEEWLNLVKESAKVLLGVCKSGDDVLTIYKNNTNIFDVVKATDANFYAELMSEFKVVKDKFEEAK